MSTKSEWESAFSADARALRSVRKDIQKLREGRSVPNLTLQNALRIEESLKQTLRTKAKLIRSLKK